jgi:hypothetical protein
MADIVDLRTRQPTSHDDSFSAELVQDLARFAEGLVTEKDIKRRYRFDAAVWEELGSNDSLIAAVEDEKTKRIRSGVLKKERAQALVTSAPAVLGEILLDKNASPKHRIDSAKALDGFAVGGSDGAGVPAADKFTITINIGDDSRTYVKSLTPDTNPLNIDATDSDTMSWEMSAALTAKKEDGGSGNTV